MTTFLKIITEDKTYYETLIDSPMKMNSLPSTVLSLDDFKIILEEDKNYYKSLIQTSYIQDIIWVIDLLIFSSELNMMERTIKSHKNIPHLTKIVDNYGNLIPRIHRTA